MPNGLSQRYAAIWDAGRVRGLARGDRPGDRPADRPGRADPGPAAAGRRQPDRRSPMRHTNDPELTPDRPRMACLERTRSAVLNVLVAVGSRIAVSGWLLRRRDRRRDRPAPPRAPSGPVVALLVAGGRQLPRAADRWRARSALRDPAGRRQPVLPGARRARRDRGAGGSAGACVLRLDGSTPRLDGRSHPVLGRPPLARWDSWP